MRRFLLSLAALLAAGPALAQQDCATMPLGNGFFYTTCSDGSSQTTYSLGSGWSETVITPPTVYPPMPDPLASPDVQFYPQQPQPQPDPWGIDAPPP